ncbi:MAG: DUF302 domain-containing protein [Oleiphilaceae bacterium]|nr:DUF302 domain-containing protein [Oleiphilaceae bacterium]
MYRILLIPVLLILFASSSAHGAQGLIAVKSNHSVETTADNLVKALENSGMTVFTRINHAEGAADVDIELAPTEVVIFGNPKAGTPLMQCGRSVAIDLPQKALIWEDDSGDVWLGYNDPEYLKYRHDLNGCDAALANIRQALTNFAGIATD